MAAKARGSKKAVIDHFITKHVKFHHKPARGGKPAGLRIEIHLEGKGESPCAHCTVQAVSICPQWPCQF